MTPPKRLHQPPRHSERGITMVEVTVAMIVVSLGALAALSCMVTTSEVDIEVKERGIALRAAMSQMERVLAYDYLGNVNNLVTWASDPSVASFTVPDLKPAGAAMAGPLGAVPISAVGQGTVAIDTTDVNRIRITVTVAWQGRKGARSLSLPVTLSELAQ